MIESTVGELYDRCVASFGPHTAITHGDTHITYREFGDNARRLTRALQDLGVGHGDTVAFLMANCPEYVFCEYALAKCGAIRVPLAVLLAPADHVYMMNEAECTTLIYHRDLQDRVLAMAPDLETVASFIRVGGDDALPEGHVALESLMENDGPDPDPVEIDPEDLAGIYFTGGTTGRPKGVMLSHRSWIYTYYSEMLELEIAWGEVFLFPTPLTHAGGCLLLPILLRRGRCVIVDHFEPESFMATIEREKVSATFLVPTMIYVLLDHPARSSFDLSSLANIVYGAAPIAPERLKQALGSFGPVMTQLFGQTEAPMMMSVLSRFEHVVDDPEREARVLGSAGRPTYQTRLRLLDEEGLEVAPGEAGEIVVQCANVMSGYLNNADATDATLRDGWLYTGDVGEVDEDGYLTIVDRKKDMVIRGGFNVYPREIEEVLHEYPAVQGVAVVGAPHEKWGEVVVAVIVLREGEQADENAIIQYVKDRKGSLVAPKIVLFWESIPLTNLGKLDKKVIRARVRESLAPA